VARCLYCNQRPLDQQLGLPVDCECSNCFTDHDLAESSPKHHNVFSHATLWHYFLLLLCVLMMAAVRVGSLSKLCIYFGEFKLDILNITSLPLNSSISVRHAVLNSCITCLDAFLSTLFLLVLHVYWYFYEPYSEICYTRGIHITFGVIDFRSRVLQLQEPAQFI